MRPAFGIFRHVERRQSNPTITEKSASSVTETVTGYQILVTRLVILWVTVWTTETDWTCPVLKPPQSGGDPAPQNLVPGINAPVVWVRHRRYPGHASPYPRRIRLIRPRGCERDANILPLATDFEKPVNNHLVIWQPRQAYRGNDCLIARHELFAGTWALFRRDYHAVNGQCDAKG